MTCHILPITTLTEIVGFGVAQFMLHRLTKPGSDFHRKLTAWLYTPAVPTEADGTIAVVRDQGEVVGWARTERWSEPLSADGSVVHWDTLEAFVAPDYRLRGIAAFAASGLYATTIHDRSHRVAVFHPAMLLTAKRAGLSPTLFHKADGRWVRS